MAKLLVTGKMETMEMEIHSLKGIFLISCIPVFDNQGCLEQIIHIAEEYQGKEANGGKIKEERVQTEEHIFGGPDWNRSYFGQNHQAGQLLLQRENVMPVRPLFLKTIQKVYKGLLQLLDDIYAKNHQAID